MRRPKYSDEVVRKLCADAIAAEGEEFQVAMAKLRDYIRRASHNLENASLASVLKVSKVIQASRKEAAREDDEEPQKRAA
jgi:hypothetical protein